MNIHGLTQHQMFLADMIWSMNNLNEVVNWIETLNGRDYYDAKSILQIMVEEIHDVECVKYERFVKELLERM